MRHNLPVTQTEYRVPADQTLVSVTDLKGRIVYCNAAFIGVSGFTRDELLGQPHNIVRHPDMPEEAFRDLWATIHAGLPWSALVKNRRKNGDYYWVRANATPMTNGDRTVGYLSVRAVPTRAEIEAAERLYARMREEAQRGRPRTGLRHGRVVRVDPLGRVARALRPGPRGRSIGLVAAAVGIAVIGLQALPIVPAIAVAAIAVAGAGWLGDRLAVAGLERVVADANRLAAGDLSHSIPADPTGIAGRLQDALRQMTVNLRTVIADCRAEVEHLRDAMEEIASGNRDLSARTEAQASSLEQTSASMEEINGAIQQSAEAAGRGARLAADAAAVTQRSHASVQGVAQAMEQIQASSGRIADIIHVVEGVSFQTNILALNAAVEAARAGEHGRGFAVVAAEVRALAQRTAASTREIKQLIAQAHERVEAGGEQTRDAHVRMNDALQAVRGVSTLLGEIGTAASEQRAGVDQISAAVMQMDGITQRNAAMVEQLAAATSSVRDQVTAVSETLGMFRLRPDDVTVAEADAVALRRGAKAISTSGEHTSG